MPYQSGYLLNKHPCAQCGTLIAAPLWSEHERNRVSFLWSCRACDYQFVTIAILKSEAVEVDMHRRPPVIVVPGEPAIAA